MLVGEVTGTDAMGSVFLKLLFVFTEFYAKQVSEKLKLLNKEWLKKKSTQVVLEQSLGMMFMTFLSSTLWKGTINHSFNEDFTKER